MSERELSAAHPSDDELFALALPATGAPEPLPPHLSECLRCSRVVAEWKSALHDLADQDKAVIARRSSEDWRLAGDATLEAIRRSGRPGRGRVVRTVAWVLPLAASLLLVAVLAGRRPSAPVPLDDTAGLSAQDREDDALLRDVDRMASGDESASTWTALVSEEESPDIPAAEDGS